MSLTRTKLYLVLSLACLAGYAWLYYGMANTAAHTADVCFIKNVTSLPCPSCGTTRAIVSLLKGDYLNSLYTNPLGLVVAAGLLILPLWIVIDIAAQKQTLFNFYCKTEHIVKKPGIAIPLVVLLAVNWIWNITKGL